MGYWKLKFLRFPIFRKTITYLYYKCSDTLPFPRHSKQEEKNHKPLLTMDNKNRQSSLQENIQVNILFYSASILHDINLKEINPKIIKLFPASNKLPTEKQPMMWTQACLSSDGYIITYTSQPCYHGQQHRLHFISVIISTMKD